MKHYPITDASYCWLATLYQECFERYPEAGEHWFRYLNHSKDYVDIAHQLNQTAFYKAFGLFESLTIIDIAFGQLLGEQTNGPIGIYA